MRWVGATVVLAGAGWVASACSSSVFACSSDAQCQAAEQGVCQPEGYCSFPDDGCPSGQRFGDAAPPGVANACVAPEGSASSGTAEAGEADEAPPDPDGGPLASTTSPSDEGTTTLALDDGPSTGPEPTTGPTSEGSTTDPAETCTTTFVDAFDGMALAREWFSFALPSTALWVEDGLLWFTIGPSPDEWVVAGTLMDLESLAGGWVRARLTEPDDSGLLVTHGLVVANEICHLQLFMQVDGLAATIWHDDVSESSVLAEVPLPTLPVWLQIRLDEDGTSHFEWSPDAVAWTEIAGGWWPECGDLLSRVEVGLNAGGQIDTMAIATRSVDEFRLCEP